MNFFFSLNHNKYKSEITIPKFSNESILDEQILVEIYIKNNKWCISSNFPYHEYDQFYIIKKTNNNSIYTLLRQEEIKRFNSEKIEIISDLTRSKPAFRSNLKIYIKGKGYSSYQHEYPYIMTRIKGNTVSSLDSVLNVESTEKHIFYKNIYHLPVHEEFKAFIIDVNKRKIIEEYQCLTNMSNFLKIKNEYVNKNFYFISKGYLGIPIYIETYENGMVSMEHTHPPHSYILENQKEIVQNFKNKILEVIN